MNVVSVINISLANLNTDSMIIKEIKKEGEKTYSILKH
jgi:hypothetical protein